MASAWGSSWGAFWGNAWGVIQEQPQTDIGGGGIYRHPGVTREMLRKHFKDILAAIEPEEVPEQVKAQVKKAVKSVAKMQQSDELTTVAAEEARAAVERAWMSLQAERIKLETNLPILQIKWLLTLQQDLSMLYAMIDDEEAAIVLLMSV